MTQEQHAVAIEMIERECERNMDRLDRQFMNGAITEQQYSKAVRDMDQRAAQQYAKLWQAA